MEETKFLFISEVLCGLKNYDNITDVSKRLKKPIPNISIILKKLSKNGLITLEKSGKYKNVLLTARGSKIKALLEEVERILKDDKN